MNIYEKLMVVQQELNAPKDLFNRFGGYSYRSAESIIEAVKPILNKVKAILLIKDEVVNVGERTYVKATVIIQDVESDIQSISSVSYAREAEAKKGMDDSQITGATSSYARKYALNGLFAIDDTKDADATNTHDKEDKKQAPKPAKNDVKQKEEINPGELNNLQEEVRESLIDLKEKGVPQFSTNEDIRVFLRDKTGNKSVKRVSDVNNVGTLRAIKDYIDRVNKEL